MKSIFQQLPEAFTHEEMLCILEAARFHFIAHRDDLADDLDISADELQGLASKFRCFMDGDQPCMSIRQPIILSAKCGADLMGCSEDVYENPPRRPQYYYEHSYPDGYVVVINDKRFRINFKLNKVDSIDVSFAETYDPTTTYRIDNNGHDPLVRFFGSPTFIQSCVQPNVEHLNFIHLMTIENNWGDCGNVNVMVQLDKDSYPVKIWMEASCC